MDGAIRAFNDFMNGGGSEVILQWCLVLLVTAPILTLVHELGHAAVGLARTEGVVLVQVGREPALVRGRIGRLVLALDPRPTTTKAEGYTLTAAKLGPGESAVYALAGPLASGGASLALVLAGLHASVGPLVLAGALGLAGSAASLVPHDVGRFQSDGRHLLRALRGQAAECTDVQEIAGRASVLFSERSRHLTERRQQLLGGAPVALGFGADDRGSAAVALWQVAFCGWCWREAQRDVDSVREAALDALHRATVTGAVEPALTGLAARHLAEAGVEFGSLFNAGLAELADGVPEEMQRFAFRYGGALREIERIRE